MRYVGKVSYSSIHFKPCTQSARQCYWSRDPLVVPAGSAEQPPGVPPKPCAIRFTPSCRNFMSFPTLDAHIGFVTNFALAESTYGASSALRNDLTTR